MAGRTLKSSGARPTRSAATCTSTRRASRRARPGNISTGSSDPGARRSSRRSSTCPCRVTPRRPPATDLDLNVRGSGTASRSGGAVPVPHSAGPERKAVSSENALEPVEKVDAAPRPAPAPAIRTRSRRSRFGEALIETLLRLNGFIAIAAISLIFVFLFKEGIQAFRTIPASHFIQSQELDFDNVPQTVRLLQPVGQNPKYSLLPLFLGSFLVALPATLVATLLCGACRVHLPAPARKRPTQA